MAGLPGMSARDPEGLAEIFRYFGEVETPRLNSGVYTAYCLGIVRDDDLLALASHTMPSQPAPNVLFAAVKSLLLDDSMKTDAADALRRFYPSISGEAIPEEDPFPAFRRFCRDFESELIPIIETGRTQTCVVHRSAIMLPAFASLPRVQASGGRVSLLEIGPSVGLNLRLDHYRFEYRDEDGVIEAWGKPAARPILTCDVRGVRPPLPGKRGPSGEQAGDDGLSIVARHGLELAPIDMDDPAALRWLRALIWPEHVERARLMSEAMEVALRVPADIRAGDATKDIERAILALPEDAPRVVFATHAVYQISKPGLQSMFEGVARASAEKPVDLLIMESSGKGDSRIDWMAFEGGERVHSELLGHSDSHGRWIDWGRKTSQGDTGSS